MATTSNHIAFRHAFDTAALAWKNPVAKMESHPYGVIFFDEGFGQTTYTYKSVFARIAELKKPERRRNRAINCVYINPIVEMCWIYDSREVSLEENITEKIEYVRTMLLDLAEDSTAPFSTVLLKNWYATESVMLLVAQLGKTYWCPIRANRLVNENGEGDHYIAVKNLRFSDQELLHGKLLSLKSFPKDHAVKLFRVTHKNGSITHVVTNQLQQNFVDADQLVGSIYWEAVNVYA